MRVSAKHLLLLTTVVAGMLSLASCENDINKIKQLSAKQDTLAVDTTTNVDVIYSDSAKVKLHMISPLMLEHKDDKQPEKAYTEMPHGVKIIFYDTTRQESGNIVSDWAIRHTASQIVEFHKNVVATNIQGDTYKSDELIWDPAAHKIYSNKPVTITRINGDVTQGSPFTSDEKLQRPFLGHGTGIYHVTDMPQN